MIVKSALKLGSVAYTFECDEKDEMEALSKAIVLANPPSECDVCKVSRNDFPEQFRFMTNKDKEANIYVKIHHKCGAQAKLGQYKAGGFFWHRFEMYVKGGENNNE